MSPLLSLAVTHSQPRAPTAGRRWLTLLFDDPASDLLQRADSARDARDWPTAANLYRDALQRGAGTVAHYVQLGHALKEMGDYSGAEAAYRRFLDECPQDADIHLQLGHLYNRQNQLALAQAWYERAHALAPDEADIAGHIATTSRRLANAADEAQRAKITALIEQRAWRDARLLLHELVVDRGHRDLIGIYANVVKESGDFEGAQALYDQYGAYAEAFAPDLRADVELQRGHLCQACGDLQRALHHYIRARDLDFARLGEVPDCAPSSQEVRACIDEIYTCFWTEHRAGANAAT
jgi:tetratricopeptide (TPR) repeat protein